MNKSYYAINDWFIDRPSGSILHLITGERKRLGAYQLKLLEVLQQNAGKIFSREELTPLVWERRVIGNNSLPNAIHALRSALEDDGKQQRIIRTIPKRGYVLEPEYLRQVDRDEKESSAVNAFPTLEANDTSIEEPVEGATQPHASDDEELCLAQVMPSDTAPAPHKETIRVSRFTSWKKLCVLALIVLIVVTVGYQAMKHNKAPEPTELAANTYSNIRIFTIPEPADEAKNQTSSFNKIKDTFYRLNQLLKSKALKMSVYYHGENQALNYTLRIYNDCEQKQLAMQIYHWRSNTTALNDLILNETRRIVDEMSLCTSK